MIIMQLSILDRMIDKLEQGFGDVEVLWKAGVPEGNVSFYIERSMAFPAANHYPCYLVWRAF